MEKLVADVNESTLSKCHKIAARAVNFSNPYFMSCKLSEKIDWLIYGGYERGD